MRYQDKRLVPFYTKGESTERMNKQSGVHLAIYQKSA